MRELIFLLLLVTSFLSATAQTEDERFLSCNGKLRLPIDQFENLDSNSYDCLMQKIRSYGITFSSAKPMKVFSVYEGKVVAKSTIDNSFFLMIRYGQYFMVYSGIEKTDLKKGDLVHTNQFIGYSYKMTDGDYSIDFFVMNGSKTIPISELFNWDSLKNPSPSKQLDL